MAASRCAKDLAPRTCRARRIDSARRRCARLTGGDDGDRSDEDEDTDAEGGFEGFTPSYRLYWTRIRSWTARRSYRLREQEISSSFSPSCSGPVVGLAYVLPSPASSGSPYSGPESEEDLSSSLSVSRSDEVGRLTVAPRDGPGLGPERDPIIAHSLPLLRLTSRGPGSPMTRTRTRPNSRLGKR